jgi:hypothetical protein
VGIWFFLLRPRGGGANAPPCVRESKRIPLPFVGVLTEFLKSPNEMMKRCYQDYGPVFTIPVRTIHYQRLRRRFFANPPLFCKRTHWIHTCKLTHYYVYYFFLQ